MSKPGSHALGSLVVWRKARKGGRREGGREGGREGDVIVARLCLGYTHTHTHTGARQGHEEEEASKRPCAEAVLGSDSRRNALGWFWAVPCHTTACPIVIAITTTVSMPAEVARALAGNANCPEGKAVGRKCLRYARRYAVSGRQHACTNVRVLQREITQQMCMTS